MAHEYSNHWRRAEVACFALLAITLAPSLDAQDEDTRNVVQSCINNAEIRRTKILGDRNIVFITRNNEIYNNQLPRQCPGLRPRSLLNYPVNNARVCAGYKFAVLWERNPGDYLPTAMCELGNFVPITEAEYQDIAAALAPNREKAERRRTSRDAITTRPVQLPLETAGSVQPENPEEPASGKKTSP